MNQHKPNIYQSNLCPPCPPTATAFEKCVYWLGIGLGSGLPKRAAGTWGTVGGLVVALPLMGLGFWGFVAVTLFGLMIGSYVCGKTSKLMGIDDDPHIVFDEWVGMWIALLPSAWVFDSAQMGSKADLTHAHASVLLILPFILFRFFDVLKPPPIKWVDNNVGGGFGILIDDVLAGIMSSVVMLFVFYLGWMG